MTFPAADKLAAIVTDRANHARNTATTKTLLGLALVLSASSSNTARMAATQAYNILVINGQDDGEFRWAYAQFKADCGVRGRYLDAYDLVGFNGRLYTVSREDGGLKLVLTSVRSGEKLYFKDQDQKFLVVA